MSRPPIAFVDLAAQQAVLRSRLEEAIARVLRHGRYILGPEVAELEAQLSARCGGAHVVSCASGTDALVMALLSLELAPGEAVVVPAFTFAATAEAVALVGGVPVFADIRADTYDLDPVGVAAALEAADRSGLRVAGLIAVDLFGQPADYPALVEALGPDRWVVADAAQSMGARVGDRPVGRLAPVTTTSFFPAKPLGCYGDGGAVLVEDATRAEVLRSIRVHGQGRDKYDTVRLGINGRLDTLQAAILIEKLTVFADELAARQAVADRYGAALAGLVAVPTVRAGSHSAWAQYTIRVPERDRVARALAAEGVPTAVYYPRPLHLQPAYRHHPVAAGGLPVSERAAREVLSLPMHPYLDEAAQDRVVEAVRAAVT